MGLQDKIRRREAAKRVDEAKPQLDVAVGNFVPATMLEAARAETARLRQNASRTIKQQRDALDDAHAVMRELLRMTEPVTVATYQGGHRAHVANVHAKVRDCLVRAGALAGKPAPVRR